MNKFENHNNYNCKIITDSGEQYNVFANWIHNQQLDHWQGWQCNAGLTRLYIDKTGDVYSGLCCNDFFGNVFDNTFTFKNAPTVCKQSRCSGCTDDLLIAKKQI